MNGKTLHMHLNAVIFHSKYFCIFHHKKRMTSRVFFRDVLAFTCQGPDCCQMRTSWGAGFARRSLVSVVGLYLSRSSALMGTTPPLLSGSLLKASPHCARILVPKGEGVCHRRGSWLHTCRLIAIISKKLCSLSFAQKSPQETLEHPLADGPWPPLQHPLPTIVSTRTVQNPISTLRGFLLVACRYPGTTGRHSPECT